MDSVASDASGAHDRAGKEYWDRTWQHDDQSPDIEPDSPSIWFHRDQLFHKTFRKLLSAPQRLSVLELGCARSAWLPYFAREFGASVSGLDYSEIGARQAAARLQARGVKGEIRCADLFDPPADWREAFDVVVWFGVAEHFDDTTKAVRAAAAFLKPGGLLITEIPNMAGINGWLQRAFNRPVYDIHVPHNREGLRGHHQTAGLDVVHAEYTVPTDFGVVEIEGAPPGFARAVKERILYGLRLFSGATWWIDRRVALPATRLLSGFVMVAARKPLRPAADRTRP
jgi:SAM-dependent methyltransferase